jgi:hypothetical protein
VKYQCCFCGKTIERDRSLIELEWGRCPLTLSANDRHPQQIANYAHHQCLTTHLREGFALILMKGREPTPLDFWPSEPPECCFCDECCPLDENLLKIRLLRFGGGRATTWCHGDCFFSRKKKADVEADRPP